MKLTDDELISAARDARKQAYCRYSGFSVGAAIVDDQDHLHVGCNVENASYPLGNCAEASAIAAMVQAGGNRIDRIAVVGGRGDPLSCTPCGGCRQRIFEFSDDNTIVITMDHDDGWQRHSISDLIPAGFRLD